MVIFVTWLWGSKYSHEYVLKLQAGLKRNIKRPYRFICITDEVIEGIETFIIMDPGLTSHNGCLARLRIFDDTWQKLYLGMKLGEDRIINIDLDSVITGDISDAIPLDDSFAILEGANSSNPCPYNGSIFSFVAGNHIEVWDDFTLEALNKVPCYVFPDDQGWLAAKLPGAKYWNVGKDWGLYAFQKPGWPKGPSDLPTGARAVFFPGARDPVDYKHLGWVAANWRV